jgi:hypothetical protein
VFERADDYGAEHRPGPSARLWSLGRHRDWLAVLLLLTEQALLLGRGALLAYAGAIWLLFQGVVVRYE